MNQDMKSFNNKRLVKSILISILIILIGVILSFIFDKTFIFGIGELLVVIGVSLLFLFIWCWNTSKKILNDPSMKINTVEELDKACEKRNDEKLTPYMNKMQKLAETRAKMDPASYKNVNITKNDEK